MQLNRKLAKKMISSCYFPDRAIQNGFNITLDSPDINHAISKFFNKPRFIELGFETKFIFKILKDMANFYARLVNQNKFKYQSVFSARFDKQDEIIQLTNWIELNINLNDHKNLTETDINKIGNKSPVQHRYREREANDSGLRFNKVNSMTKYFYKLVEKKGFKLS